MGTSGATNGLVETRTVRFCGNFNEEGIPASNGTQSGAADPVADSDGGDGGGGGGDDRVSGDNSAAPIVLTHTGEFSLVYVSKGACALHCENQETRRLEAGGYFSVPAGVPHSVSSAEDGTELFEIFLPGGG
jgi:hypothetical protein